MRFFTKTQKSFFVRRDIKVGGFYPFPMSGFHIYAEPNYLSGQYMDCNPMTKSLQGEYFVVKSITNGFCKGNFKSRAKGSDFYIVEEELSQKPLIEILLLFVLLSIPFMAYNLINGGVEKIENKKESEQQK